MAGPDNLELARLLSLAFDPIIDVCLRLGVSTGELESLLRVEFVRRASATLPSHSRSKKPKAPTHEQVALAVGLLRSQVQMIRSQDGKREQQKLRKKSQRLAKIPKVLETWKSDPEFMDTSGGPLALPVYRQLASPSFETLVAKTLGSTGYLTVLKDLQRRGMVQVTDDIARIRRPARALPTDLNTPSVNLIAEQMRQVGGTILQTILNPAGPNPDPLALFAATDPITIPADAVESFRTLLQEHVANFVQGLERDLARRSKKSKHKGPDVVIGTSVYTYSNK